MQLLLEKTWDQVLTTELKTNYFKQLKKQVDEAYRSEAIYPPAPLVFNAFNHCPFNKVKVVILGQDPYHGADQAHGLAFSVPEGIKIPPSLRNIYKELESDLGIKPSISGNLERWADQGVLLLNSTLSVRAGAAGSHQKFGWETFTDTVIKKLSDDKEHLVFLLWGKYAEVKGKNIDSSKHLVLKAAHPSPLSAYNGFFGCKHFSQCNSYLEDSGKKPIVW